MQVVTLAHPSLQKVSCLFKDASERNWSGILSQIPQEDCDQPFADQLHEPLAFLSGSFKGGSSRWSTAEKEASAIVNSVERLDYLLLRPSGSNFLRIIANFFLFIIPRSLACASTKRCTTRFSAGYFTLPLRIHYCTYRWGGQLLG